MPPPTLVELMTQCEFDTRAVCGARPANRLHAWRNHQHNEVELITFIRRCIRNPQGQANGFRLCEAGRLSLEEIVLRQRPELFSEEDRQVAIATLGNFAARCKPEPPIISLWSCPPCDTKRSHAIQRFH